ncbi:MAG: hypothetical protein EBR82_79305 [Caulobacteraceae bacterium]|nr:hypothetical protein [Caulobacteraceae bacterium]
MLVQATALTYEAGEAFTGYNLYPGKAVLWNVNTNTFTNYGDCYIRVIGGGTIQDTALQFIGRAIGVWSDDKIVFSVQIVSGGGGTVTVKESDGDPLLNAIDTLSFYAGQFVVTNPAANVAQINLHPTLADLSSYASLGLFLADKGYQDMHFHRHTYAGGVWHGTGVALRPLVFAYRAPSVPGGVGLDSGIMYLMPYFEARGGSLDRIAVQVQAFTCAEGSAAKYLTCWHTRKAPATTI